MNFMGVARTILNKTTSLVTQFLFFSKFGVKAKRLYSVGIPNFKNLGGAIIIDGSPIISMINTSKASALGYSNPCKISIAKDAELHLKGKVAMSNTSIFVAKKITIGDNVMIGGGCTIVDTDFHSFNPDDWFTGRDGENKLSKEVLIGNNVFIGMKTIILKGVIIGDNVIIGAGSVVTKSIPDNEVWAGNPAVYIKTIKR